MTGSIRRLAKGLAVIALAVTSAAATQPRAGPPQVESIEGPIRGRTIDGIDVFSGIPFAAPPTGANRFRSPQPVARWTVPLVADRTIPFCIQFNGPMAARKQSEDCLYLSLWRPAGGGRQRPLPVMVWIFGGGMVGGGPAEFDGAKLAREGVVVVTLNHRVGIFGMMTDPSLDEPGALSGNYALRDQQAALRWVQRNVARFGGDPRNVTLFGQSSGGSSVLMQMASPLAANLFHKAIVQSSGEGARVRDRTAVQAGASKQVIEAVGCAERRDLAACLRSAPASAFVEARIPMSASGADAGRALGIVTDPALLPAGVLEAFHAGRFNKVPVMNGTNLHEGAMQVLAAERRLARPLREADVADIAAAQFFGAKTAEVLAAYPTKRYGFPDVALMKAVTDFRQACPTDATRRALARHVTVYGYEMTEAAPQQDWPGPDITNIENTPRHSTELAYVFGAWNGNVLTGDAERLSARMRRHWTNFAKLGTPDPSPRKWPSFTVRRPAVLLLQQAPALSFDFAERHGCAFMKTSGLVKY